MVSGLGEEEALDPATKRWPGESAQLSELHHLVRSVPRHFRGTGVEQERSQCFLQSPNQIQTQLDYLYTHRECCSFLALCLDPRFLLRFPPVLSGCVTYQSEA